MCAIGEGVTKALLDFARPLIALYVGGMGARGKNFYNDLFCDYGFEKEAKEIQDLYLDGKKQEAEALVPMEFLEAMNLVGPESYVKERIAAYQESGVTNLPSRPGPRTPRRPLRRSRSGSASCSGNPRNRRGTGAKLPPTWGMARPAPGGRIGPLASIPGRIGRS